MTGVSAALYSAGDVWAETGTYGGMLTGITPSSGDDLDRLRLRYEQLCDLVTRTAEADPDAAERILVELQSVSEQILALQETASIEPVVPAPAAEAAQADPEAAGPTARPEQPPAAAPVETAPSAPDAPPRVVAFRAGPETPADATDAPETAAAPVAPPEAKPVQQEPQPAHALPAAAPAGGSATVFSSAIRQWLEQRRGAVPAQPAQTPRSGSSPPATRVSVSAAHSPAAARAPADVPAPFATGQDAPAPAEDREPGLARLAAAVEQQAVQIERILALCESHQIALERLEERIEARLAATSSAAAAEPGDAGSELPALRGAVEEQRQRITALAKTIHNLAQWLASQRSTPGR